MLFSLLIILPLIVNIEIPVAKWSWDWDFNFDWDFDELINKIQEYAYEVKKKYIHIKDIKVIGIDYSDNKETIE